jgi:hypothetical protein
MLLEYENARLCRGEIDSSSRGMSLAERIFLAPGIASSNLKDQIAGWMLQHFLQLLHRDDGNFKFVGFVTLGARS